MNVNRLLTEKQMSAALEWDIHGDSFDAHRTVFNKIVTARKPYECQNCWGPINVGEQCRSAKILFPNDGTFQTFRWCFDCCAVSDNNDSLVDRCMKFSERKDKP